MWAFIGVLSNGDIRIAENTSAAHFNFNNDLIAIILDLILLVSLCITLALLDEFIVRLLRLCCFWAVG